MTDKVKTKQPKKWHQRPFTKIGTVLILLLCYQFIKPKEEKAENKLDIGGPKVVLKQNVSTKPTPVISSPAPSPIEDVSVADDNVTRAYHNSNWQPHPTSQAEPHTTTFDTDSTDRLEIRAAIQQVTQIPESQLEEWWVGATGSDQVTATVSNLNTDQAYRISLAWQPHQGWLVTLVEELSSLPSYF